MMEEQIKEMAKIACVGSREGDCENCKSVGICSSYTISEKLYNAGYRKQEWISVEERLPEIDKNGKGRYGDVRSVKVLCACKQKDGKYLVKEGYYEPCGNGSVYWRIPGSLNSVTHWMPLPEAPKGGAE